MRHRADPDDLSALDARARGGSPSARVRIGVGAGVVLLLVGLVGAVLITTLVPRGGVREIAPTANGFATSRPSDAGATPVPGAPVLLVHVLGAVKRPGIVELRPGSRVLDAIAAAGGLDEGADPAGVNLARPVSDGEQLVVPRVGEVPPAQQGAGNSSAAGGAINLNTASVYELQTLPQIGPTLAQRIVDWREQNGRFSVSADLMKVNGIGQTLFDGLRDLVTV